MPIFAQAFASPESDLPGRHVGGFRMASFVVANSVDLREIPELSIPLPPNALVRFRAFFDLSIAAAAGARIGVGIPQGVILGRVMARAILSLSPVVITTLDLAGLGGLQAVIDATPAQLPASDRRVEIEGMLQTGAFGGILQFVHAQNTAQVAGNTVQAASVSEADVFAPAV